MVSGLVTSPCDHDRIFSGEARLIRIASKSLVSAERSWNEGRIYLLPPGAPAPRTPPGAPKLPNTLHPGNPPRRRFVREPRPRTGFLPNVGLCPTPRLSRLRGPYAPRRSLAG